MTRFSTTLSLVLVAFGASAGTPVPLFSDVDNCIDCSPPPLAYSLVEVELNIDGLSEWPDTISIDDTIGYQETATLDYFAPREGYIDDPNNHPLCDEIPGEDCEVIPDPNAPDDAFSFLWRGTTSSGGVVMLSVTRGVMTGVIMTTTDRYSIRQIGGVHTMRRLRVQDYPPMDPDMDLGSTAQAAPHAKAKPTDEQVGTKTLECTPPVSTYPIDVLVVYTPDALADAGSIASMESAIQSFEDYTNDVLIGSEVNYHVAFWGVQLETSIVFETALSPAQNALKTIADMTSNPSLNALRDSFGTDQVIAIVGSTEFPNFCGVAITQRQSCDLSNQFVSPSCSVGTAFEDFAYSLARFNCAADLDAATHELGHNWGGEHNYANGPQNRNDASFPWSYGYNLQPGGTQEDFHTVMSIAVGTAYTVFSNPCLSNFDLNLLGEEDLADNHRTFNALGTVFSDFRDRPDPLFFDSFE